MSLRFITTSELSLRQVYFCCCDVQTSLRGVQTLLRGVNLSLYELVRNLRTYAKTYEHSMFLIFDGTDVSFQSL